MPKANHSVIALNETTGLRERISPHKDIREKYKNVGKPRRVQQPSQQRLIHRVLTPEEYAEIAQEYDKEMVLKRLFSELTLEKRKLEDRISSPPKPLAERIASPEPYEEPKPLPKEIKFRKTKIIKRIDEFNNVFTAVHTRLAPLFKRLKVEDENKHYGLPERVDFDRRNRLWGFFKQIEEGLENKSIQHELTNAQWRRIRGAMKRVGKVKLDDLEENLEEICRQLDEIPMVSDS